MVHIQIIGGDSILKNMWYVFVQWRALQRNCASNVPIIHLRKHMVLHFWDCYKKLSNMSITRKLQCILKHYAHTLIVTLVQSMMKRNWAKAVQSITFKRRKNIYTLKNDSDFKFFEF